MEPCKGTPGKGDSYWKSSFSAYYVKISSEYWKNIWAQDPYYPNFLEAFFWCAQESGECCGGYSSLSICSGRKSTGEKKNTGKLEGFALCHGESTGAPEKQGPYEGTMVVFSSLDKALFPWGAWQGRFFGSKAPQKWRKVEEMKPEADWHYERRDSKHWPLLLVFLRFRNIKFHLFVINWAMKTDLVVWGIL